MELKEVFEPIVNFMKNFQKKDKDISKQAAKDRLKLVLMQDRASVSPDFFEMMKKEIIDVIKKYIEIDEESLEVQLTRGYEAGLEGPALYANIPIKNIKPVASKVDGDVADDRNIEELSETIANEILDEAEKKVEDAINDGSKEKVDTTVKIEIENLEKKSEDKSDLKSVDSIAENVAKEMKKTAKASTTKSTTVRKPRKTTTTARKVTKKTTVSE